MFSPHGREVEALGVLALNDKFVLSLSIAKARCLIKVSLERGKFEEFEREFAGFWRDVTRNLELDSFQDQLNVFHIIRVAGKQGPGKSIKFKRNILFFWEH